jgi:16S rRNA (cytosine1402-N4)-methyltransferase
MRCIGKDLDHPFKRRTFTANPMTRTIRHIPVLLGPVLALLNVRPNSIIVDCTLGLGGHSAEILKRLAGGGGQLIATDFDPHSLELARANLSRIGREGKSFHLFQTNFAGLLACLASLGIEKIDGLLADLGVSSPQIDDPARGFSYRQPGPLDMRMDPHRGQTAAALLAKISEKDLAEALIALGDEEDALKVARAIVEERKETPIETTEHLARIVSHARDFTVVRAAGAKLHPAARTFQALRILVNREHANLERLLKILPDLLRPGGIAALIAFHSGEDRPIKHAFRDGLRSGVYAEISPDPLLADDAEIAANPRSRSAKLRWARRNS